MAISSFSNPIPEIIDGLLRGHQLGLQLRQAKRADEEFKTQQLLHNQQLQAGDILAAEHRQKYGRPVENGTIQEQMNMTLPGMAHPGAVPGEESNLNNLPARPSPSLDTPVSYVRKPDASRTTTEKDSQGNKYTTEWLTPEERSQQQQAQAEQMEAAKRRGGSYRYDPPPDVQSQYGIPGSPMYVPDAQVVALLNALAGNKQVTTTPEQQAVGMPATVPQKVLPTVITQTGANTRNVRTNEAREANTGANIESKEKIADQNITSREKIAGESQAGQNTRATARNQTTLDAAGIRSNKPNQPTAGQSNVENRFEQRRRDDAQKQINAIQAREDELHAERLKLGETMKTGTMTPAGNADAAAKIKSLGIQVEMYQRRKAAIASRYGAPQQSPAAAPAAAQPVAAPAPAAAPPPPPDGQPQTLQLPPELAKKLGKTHVTFPNRESMQKFLDAAGMSVTKQ